MSPGKHKSSRDEECSKKSGKRNENLKSSETDHKDYSYELKRKEKRNKKDRRDERIDDEDSDYNAGIRNKGEKDEYDINVRQKDDYNSDYKRKEKGHKLDKEKRLDQENDYYSDENQKKVKNDKDDVRLNQESSNDYRRSKKKEKKDKKDKSLYENEDYAEFKKQRKRNKYDKEDEKLNQEKESYETELERNDDRYNEKSKKSDYNPEYNRHKRDTPDDRLEKHRKERNSSHVESDSSEDKISGSKSERIHSAVHKVDNKFKRNSDVAKPPMKDTIDYESDENNETYRSKHRKSLRSEINMDRRRERHIDEQNDSYSKKRRRNSDSETETNYSYLRRKPRIEGKERNEQDNSAEDFGENLKPTAAFDPSEKDNTEPLSKRQKIGNINMRTGGAYIPPARLRMMQESIKDKGSEAYQRIAWEALKKSIVGMTNKVNGSNITEIIPELFKENIIRGRGILTRAIMQAQAASPTFTRVYSSLVAIINTKFPEIGELLLKRLIIQYKRGFRRNDKTVCMSAARFLAHLLNQEVAHEVLILEMVTHLLENPTDDSVEIAIATLKECGKKLTLLTPRGMRAITQRVRDVLHEGNIEVRVRYMIEVFFAVQKDGFKDFEVIPEELDLVEEDDKYTHLINLDDAVDSQDMLNVFKFDPDYLENEEKYKSVVNEILGDSSDEEESGNESDSEEEGEEKEDKEDSQQILDMTETNIVCLRRKIYLTIQSSLDFEECAHKLLKLELKPGQILEMCYMILDCCAQQRTYEKFYGLLAQRFCQLNKIYVEPFTEIFENSYKTIHRLETNKLRNVAKFFAHLLYTDAISWNVLSIIKLNEEDTTSSSRIFIKILFQELCEYMGLPKLNERVKDVTLQEAFEGLFPRDHPHNTRFAINFFTSIGLGGLTDELREHLKSLPKNPVPLVPDVTSPTKSSSSSDSSSSGSSSSSSSSSSESEESDSKTKKKKQQKRKKGK